MRPMRLNADIPLDSRSPFNLFFAAFWVERVEQQFLFKHLGLCGPGYMARRATAIALQVFPCV